MDSTYRGVMKIFMQYIYNQAKEASHSLQIPTVPYDGSQRAPAEHRKSQAQSIPVDDFDIDSQLNVLSTLTIKQYKSSPKILCIKFET